MFIVLGFLYIGGRASHWNPGLSWIMLDITSAFLVFISNKVNADAEDAVRFREPLCSSSRFELPSIIFAFMVGISIIVANLRCLVKRGIYYFSSEGMMSWENLLRNYPAYHNAPPTAAVGTLEESLFSHPQDPR